MAVQGNYQERLIHIKLLFLRAPTFVEKKDDISLIMLVQLLDFVVETFLRLVIDSFAFPTNFAPPQRGYHYKISKLESEPIKNSLDFYRLCDEVVGRLRDTTNGLSISDLPLRRDMERLHEIRNDVQHKGAIPNPKDVQKYLPLVESFLNDSYNQIFGVDYVTLSGLSLINDPDMREKMQKSHEALNNGEWTDAVCEAAIAFYKLLQLARKHAHPNGVWEIRKKFDEVTYSYDGRVLDLTSRGQRAGIAGILEEIERLQEHVTIVGFGIDYGEYVAVKPLLPQIDRGSFDIDGQWHEGLTAVVPMEYSEELNNFVPKVYSENEARMAVYFVEKQVLEFQASNKLH